MSRGPDEQARFMGAGVLAATSGSAAFAAFEFLLAVILTRGLGAAEAGVFFSVMSLFMIALGVMMIGPTQGLIRLVAHAVALDRRDDVRHLTLLAVLPATLAAAAIAIAAWLAAPSISELVVGSNQAEAYLRAIVPLLPCAVAMHLVLAASRGIGTMKPTVIVDRIGVGAARPLLVGLALLAGGGSIAVGVAWAVPYALALLGAAIWVGRVVSSVCGDRRRSVTDPKALGRSLWGFSLVRGTAASMELTTRWADIPLVAALASPEAAGIYAAVSRLTLAGSIALRGVVLSFTPQISSLIARRDLSGARRAYRLATCWTMTVSLPVYLILIGYPDLLLEPFGPGFGAGATALVIICVGKLAGLLFGPIGVVLLMEGRTWLNALNAAVGMAINLGLNIWLIPAIGIEGAAIAWGVSLLYLNIAPMAQLYRSDRYQPIGRGWVVLVLAAALAFGLVGVLTPAVLGLPDAVGVGVFALIGGPLYVAILHRHREAVGLDALLWSLRRRRPLALPPAAPPPAA